MTYLTYGLISSDKVFTEINKGRDIDVRKRYTKT